LEERRNSLIIHTKSRISRKMERVNRN